MTVKFKYLNLENCVCFMNHKTNEVNLLNIEVNWSSYFGLFAIHTPSKTQYWFNVNVNYSASKSLLTIKYKFNKLIYINNV